jgi:hypothetical protein
MAANTSMLPTAWSGPRMVGYWIQKVTTVEMSMG